MVVLEQASQGRPEHLEPVHTENIIQPLNPYSYCFQLTGQSRRVRAEDHGRSLPNGIVNLTEKKTQQRCQVRSTRASSPY